MVDKTIQEERKEYLVNLLKTLGGVNINKEKLKALLLNDAFNSKFGDKTKSWTFFDALNSGVNSAIRMDSVSFENMSSSAISVIAKSQIDKSRNYKTIDISEEEILKYYRGDEVFKDRGIARMNTFIDEFLELFNNNELDDRVIEQVISDNYFNGMYFDIENNPNYVANLFVEAKLVAIRKRYMENKLDNIPNLNFSKELKETMNTLNVEDIKKEMFSHYIHSSKWDTSISYLNNIWRALCQGYEEYVEKDVESIIDRAIVSKFMSMHDNQHKKDFERDYGVYKQDWTKSCQSLGINIDKVLEFMMECYSKDLYPIEIDNDFIEYLKNTELTEFNMRHLFVTMYDMFSGGQESYSRYAQIINWLKYPLLKYGAKKELESKINSVKAPDSLGYIRSKARDVLDAKLQEDVLKDVQNIENARRLQNIIDEGYEHNQENIDNEVLEYFRGRIQDKTADNMTRGILSEEFMENHGYELIKIIASSEYDDKIAMRMIKDIVKKDTIVEPNM